MQERQRQAWIIAAAATLLVGCVQLEPGAVPRHALDARVHSFAGDDPTTGSEARQVSGPARRPRDDWAGPLIHTSIRYEQWEFDEITFDIIDDLGTKFGESDAADQERKRIEVRVGAGQREIAAFLSLSGEQFLEDDDGDFFGVGVGVQGAPVLVGIGPESWLFLEYEASGSFHVGEGETAIILLPSLTIIDVDEDLEYFEGILRAGAGVELPHGLRLSAGVVASFIDGEYDIDGV